MPAPPALPEVVAEAARPPAEETVEAVLERLHAVHRALGNNTVPESHRLLLQADSLPPDDGLSSFNHLYTVITADTQGDCSEVDFRRPR
jgi:hypothetical protein